MISGTRHVCGALSYMQTKHPYTTLNEKKEKDRPVRETANVWSIEMVSYAGMLFLSGYLTQMPYRDSFSLLGSYRLVSVHHC